MSSAVATFQPIVSKYLHETVMAVQHMRSPGSFDITSGIDSHGPTSPGNPAIGDVVLVRLDSATLLLTATPIYLVPDTGTDGAWYVLGQRTEQAEYAPNKFTVRGIVDPNLNSYFFINQAYRAILLRSAEEAGLINYIELLENETISRRTLLITIAESPEAQLLRQTVYLVPESSIKDILYSPPEDTEYVGSEYQG